MQKPGFLFGFRAGAEIHIVFDIQFVIVLIPVAQQPVAGGIFIYRQLHLFRRPGRDLPDLISDTVIRSRKLRKICNNSRRQNSQHKQQRNLRDDADSKMFFLHFIPLIPLCGFIVPIVTVYQFPAAFSSRFYKYSV